MQINAPSEFEINLRKSFYEEYSRKIYGDYRSNMSIQPYARFEVTSFSYCWMQGMKSSPTGTLFFRLK